MAKKAPKESRSEHVLRSFRHFTGVELEGRSAALPDSEFLRRRIFLSVLEETKHLAGVAAKRSATVFPDDVFIVSYPKSGSTWIRFLVGNVISEEAVTFANLEQVVPEIYHHSDKRLKQFPRPRVIKSHEYFHPAYPRVVYVVRDPRDLAVSALHHHIKRGRLEPGFPLEDFIPPFMRGEFDHAHSWADNVISWLATRLGTDTFLLVRYEDLLADTPGELARVVAFMGIETTRERLMRAVELSSADRMRKLEQQEPAWDTLKGSRLNMPFVRKAAAGGWRTSLPEDSLRQLESAWGRAMRILGYEPVTPEGGAAAKASSFEALLAEPFTGATRGH